MQTEESLDTSDRDPNYRVPLGYIEFKVSEEWPVAYNELKSVLAEREHWPSKGDRKKKRKEENVITSRCTIRWFATVLFCFCGYSLAACAKEPRSYWALRRKFETNLVERGPSPQPFEPLKASENISVFAYESDEITLKGFLSLPSEERRKTEDGYPVLLYLHGGWALGLQDILDCQVFIDDGYAVVAPSYRGENGNPGYHEMFYGELNDAVAVLDWIRNNKELDGSRIVVFGYSAGGALSALMTLVPDLNLKAIGSAGGFYAEAVFEAWDAPFELTEREKQLRVAYRWVNEFRYPHLACVGENDAHPAAVLRSVIGKSSMLAPEFVSGDHFSSLSTCFSSFLKFANQHVK